MSGISYSPSQDPANAAFRMLCILTRSPTDPIELGRLLIYDFYLCFPWLIATIEGTRKVPNFVRDRNRLAKLYPQNSYDKIPEARNVFIRMRPAQLAAINSMGAFNLLDVGKLREGRVQRTDVQVPSPLAVRIKAFLGANAELIEFLTLKVIAIPLLGPDGLKHKSGLEEYRYDDV